MKIVSTVQYFQAAISMFINDPKAYEKIHKGGRLKFLSEQDKGSIACLAIKNRISFQGARVLFRTQLQCMYSLTYNAEYRYC